MDAHLDEEGLARRWQMSPRTLQRWRQTRKGPAYLKLGSRIVFRLSDIEAYENDHLQGRPDKPEPDDDPKQ